MYCRNCKVMKWRNKSPSILDTNERVTQNKIEDTELFLCFNTVKIHVANLVRVHSHETYLINQNFSSFCILLLILFKTPWYKDWRTSSKLLLRWFIYCCLFSSLVILHSIFTNHSNHHWKYVLISLLHFSVYTIFILSRKEKQYM